MTWSNTFRSRKKTNLRVADLEVIQVGSYLTWSNRVEQESRVSLARRQKEGQEDSEWLYKSAVIPGIVP